MNIKQRTVKRVKPVGKHALTQPEVDFLRNRVGISLASLEVQAEGFKATAKALKKAGGSTYDLYYKALARVKLEIKKLAGIQHKLKNLDTL